MKYFVSTWGLECFFYSNVLFFCPNPLWVCNESLFYFADRGGQAACVACQVTLDEDRDLAMIKGTLELEAVDIIFMVACWCWLFGLIGLSLTYATLTFLWRQESLFLDNSINMAYYSIQDPETCRPQVKDTHRQADTSGHQVDRKALLDLSDIPVSIHPFQNGEPFFFSTASDMMRPKYVSHGQNKRGPILSGGVEHDSRHWQNTVKQLGPPQTAITSNKYSTSQHDQSSFFPYRRKGCRNKLSFWPKASPSVATADWLYTHPFYSCVVWEQESSLCHMLQSAPTLLTYQIHKDI